MNLHSFIFLASTIANAAIDGNKVIEACRFYPLHTEASSFCMGYIMGVFDDMRVWVDVSGPKTVCLTSNVSGEQLISVAIKFMKDKLGSLQYTASSHIAAAFLKPYPCL